jgi:hypothetical protein
MGSISKSVAYNVGKSGDPAVPRRVTYKGSRRGEKIPRGVVERFVDLQGNVVTCSLVGPGIPATPDAIARERANLHARKNGDGTVIGYVEHGKCPLRHGTRHRNPVLEDEFTKMPAELQKPCDGDPAGSTRQRDAAGTVVVHGDACPHIEWLISERRATALARQRNRGISALELEQRKVELLEAQTKAAQETQAKLVEALTTRQPRKAAE